MGSGGINSQISRLNDIGSKQTNLAGTLGANAGADYGAGHAAMDPVISNWTKLFTGSPKEVTAAAMPALTPLTQSQQATTEAIKNSMPPGPARDLAMAKSQRDFLGQIGTAKSGIVQGAGDKLFGAGTGLLNLSTSEYGGALGGYSGAASTTQQALQAEVQKRQSMLNFFGGLAKIAAAPLTGGLSMFSGGGGGGVQGGGFSGDPYAWMQGSG